MLVLALLSTFLLVQSQNRFPGFWTPACCDTPLPDDNCSCDYATCSWWGDPHTTTFDGLYHHFQGRPGRRYRYVTPCQSDFQTMPFQVVVRHRRCGRRFTCSDYVDIRLHNPTTGAYVETIRIDNGPLVQRFIEPAGPSGPNLIGGQTYAGGLLYVVTRTSSYAEVAVFTGQLCDYRPDIVVRANRRITRVNVELNDYYKYQSCGICGYYSGTQCDELAVAFRTRSSPRRDICYQFDNNLPRRMRKYSRQNWRNINRWGWFWSDFGIGIRRLQDGTELPPLTEDLLLQLDDNTLLEQSPDEIDETPFDNLELANAQAAEDLCDSLRDPNTCDADELFCDDCADEVAARIEDCDQLGGLNQQCIDLVCAARCEGDNCEDVSIEDILDGTAQAEPQQFLTPR